MKNVFWDVTPFGSCKNRRFEGEYRLHHQGIKNRLTTLAVTSKKLATQLLVKAKVVTSSPILFTLMMEAIRSSETSVLTNATRHGITERAILHRRRRHKLNY
jgi:hypothetical protein